MISIAVKKLHHPSVIMKWIMSELNLNWLYYFWSRRKSNINDSMVLCKYVKMVNVIFKLLTFEKLCVLVLKEARKPFTWKEIVIANLNLVPNMFDCMCNGIVSWRRDFIDIFMLFYKRESFRFLKKVSYSQSWGKGSGLFFTHHHKITRDVNFHPNTWGRKKQEPILSGFSNHSLVGKQHKFLLEADCASILFLMFLFEQLKCTNLIGWVKISNFTYIQTLGAPAGSGCWQDTGWVHTTALPRRLCRPCSQGRRRKSHPTGHSRHHHWSRG